MTDDDQHMFDSARAAKDVDRLMQSADRLLRDGDLHAAATSLDRAYGLNPSHSTVVQRRAELLDQLAVNENGIQFRYIPGGTFLMGSNAGDPDEQPVHEVQLNHYWLSETAISWEVFCRVLGWQLPPDGGPLRPWPPQSAQGLDPEQFELLSDKQIRLQYCEDLTLRAQDWHAHFPPQNDSDANREQRDRVFGKPARSNADAGFSYKTKPMACVRFSNTETFCSALSRANSDAKYRLPTEAEWEKAARGGLIGKVYPWGDEVPTNQNCDFNRFEEFSICPMKTFPPNSYGLYSMSGGVWEWTSDWYDAEYYAESPSQNPVGPMQGIFRSVRGGSWADCAQAVTVSFRMTLDKERHPWATNPNIGFRICRCTPSTVES